jgi:hypothetical protein
MSGSDAAERYLGSALIRGLRQVDFCPLLAGTFAEVLLNAEFCVFRQKNKNAKEKSCCVL